jgi:hypothetical protein
MAEQILQINFKFNVAAAEYRKLAQEIAGAFAEVEGLRWKVWILNEQESEAGGIYLFDGEQSLGAFVASPLAAQVKGHPALSEFSAKAFAVEQKATAITRGPIG